MAVIQTYRPDHYSIIKAASQNYEDFYEEEILYRELGSYPPAAHMMAVLVTSAREERGEKLARQLTVLAKNFLKEGKAKASVIGPAKASIGKINDIYRFVMYCKAFDYGQLTSAKDKIEQYLETLVLKEENVQFDFDPVDSL